MADANLHRMKGRGDTTTRRRRTALGQDLRARSGTSSGQALVEMALVTPILLILVGAVDLGRIFYARIAVTNAAREGALMASREPGSWSAGAPCSTSNRVMCAATHESSGSWVTIAPADVAMTCTPGCTVAAGTTVTVTVTGRFQLLTPLMSIFTGGSDITFADSATADVVSLPVAGVMPTPAASVIVATARPTSAATASPSPGPTATATGPAPTASPTAKPSPTASPTPSPSPTCPPPLVSFTSKSGTGQDGGEHDDDGGHSTAAVLFTSTSTPTSGSCKISYWRWAFGDGDTDAGNLPSVLHDYGRSNRNRTFTVTLTVTTPSGTFSCVATVRA